MARERFQNPEESTRKARAQRDIRRVVTDLHGGPTGPGESWKKFTCPFCSKKKAAIFRTNDGTELFKCFSRSCESASQALDETGFIALRCRMSRADAWKQWLKDAGVWIESSTPYKPHISPAKFDPSDVGVEPEDFAAKSTQPTDQQPEEAAPTTPPVAVGLEKAASVESAAAPPEPAAIQDSCAPAPASMGSTEPADEASPAPDPAPGGSSPEPQQAFSPPLNAPLPESPDPNVQAGHDEPPGDSRGAPISEDDDPKPAPSSGHQTPVTDSPDPGLEDQSLVALREFYGALALDPKDEADLWIKRGLTPASCQAFGLKSNTRQNEAILLGLLQRFPLQVLIEAGLFTRDQPDRPARPNPQFYGWGIAGKKPADEVTSRREDLRFEWDWTEPVLIPYFDATGKLIGLRPHKGMIGGKPPQFYVARPQGQPLRPLTPGMKKLAIVTEGEFKAMALWQAFANDPDRQVHVGSLPGIQMSKRGESGTWFVRASMFDWLASLEITSVIVAFDNEDKGTRGLPGYKPQKWKRHDTAIWSLYLARQLELGEDGAYYESSVCTLPDTWRNAKGKADWDGALAMLIEREQGATPTDWPRVEPAVRTEFWRALSSSQRYERAIQGLFQTEAGRIIRSQLDRYLYEPRLPAGTEREEEIGRRLAKASLRCRRAVAVGPANYLFALSRVYMGLKGVYYTLDALNEKQAGVWHQAKQRARESGDRLIEWACAVVLKGRPLVASDFTIKFLFHLKRLDDRRDVMVRLTNIHGARSEVVPLTSESQSSPKSFRAHLRSLGPFAWLIGERELQALTADSDRALHNREVTQLPAFGSEKIDGEQCWFFDDCMLTNVDGRGQVVLPDEHGVIWWNGNGYLIGKKGLQEQPYKQGRPKMHPEERPAPDPTGFEYAPWPPGAPPELSPRELQHAFFREFCERIKETIGGYEGYLAIGAVLAYAAAPEVFAAHHGFGGLWCHGERGGGKSTLASWLMSLWGFDLTEGLGLGSGTSVGFEVALEQYSNLPVWANEAQHAELEGNKQKILHAAYNREVLPKFAINGECRAIRTSIIVTGEGTLSKAGTRSRYPHALVSERARRGNHFPWLRAHAPSFYVFGRELLLRRPEFVAALTASLAEWDADPALSKVDTRARLVYGTVYSAMAAAGQLFASHSAEEIAQFRAFMLEACYQAQREQQNILNVDAFWHDVISAATQGVFGETRSELARYFKVIRRPADHPPDAPHHGTWDSVELYIRPRPVHDLLQAFKRRQDARMPLDTNDLAAQMSKRPYWIRSSSTNGLQQRFGSGKSYCWGVRLDLYPELGYHYVSDEEWNGLIAETLTRADEAYNAPLPSQRPSAYVLAGKKPDELVPAFLNWARNHPDLFPGDPRLGELYSLVNLIEGGKEDSP